MATYTHIISNKKILRKKLPIDPVDTADSWDINYSNYDNTVKENLDVCSCRWDFKNNEYYNQILEHLTYEDGEAYLTMIKKQPFYAKNKDYIINLCKENDSLGKPVKYDYVGFTECSPSNLRYIYHCIQIFIFADYCSLNNIDFVEIGGGYGGLAFFIHGLSKIFHTNVNSYTMYDLPQASQLQKRYLKERGIDVQTTHLDDDNDDVKLNKHSFLISNYSFSEISPKLQQKYKERVLNPYISHGFLVWNLNELYKFIDNRNITKVDHHPVITVLEGEEWVPTKTIFYIYITPNEMSIVDNSMCQDDPELITESSHVEPVLPSPLLS